MPHELDLLLTLAGGLGAALVLGVLTQRLRLSPIVGYLLAGIAVGPFTPGFVAHGQIAQEFSELGVILLMFGVGLQFHAGELLAVRKIVAPGALIQLGTSTAAGILLAHVAGWSLGASIVFGIAISIASTVVAIRMLSDSDALQTPAGRAAIGWLVIEDLLTVLVLVLLPIVGGGTTGMSGGAMALAIAIALLKTAALVAFTLVGGRFAIPVLLRYVSRLHSRELFTLSVLVLALGIALGSAALFGVSMALGAFLAGMVVGQSEFSSRAASDALPMRDAFAVLFFVAMGMLLDPAALLPNAALIGGMLVVILLVTPLVTYAAARLLGAPHRTGLTLAISLAQIGEFSFILATMGRKLDLLPENAMQCLVASSIVSITVNPLLFRLFAPAPASPAVPPGLHRTIVVGFGPVGRAVAALLRENSIEATIVELDAGKLDELRAGNWQAIEGDASDPDVLERAGVRTATSLVLAASTPADAIIRAAKALNPELLVLARASRISDVAATRSAGATGVVAAEVEVALAMVERILARLGATRDQLDRARDRVRGELTPGDA